jgi:hypothetical protein
MKIVSYILCYTWGCPSTLGKRDDVNMKSEVFLYKTQQHITKTRKLTLRGTKFR